MGLADRYKRTDASLNSYQEIVRFREEQIRFVAGDHFKLNAFHDQMIKQTVQLAMGKVQSEWGDPPAPFAFFLMGSAGRYEQSVWSDQDHGLIYNGNDDNCKPYFLMMGQEITEGLHQVGYELCDGKVMSLNPLWCHSMDSWKKQISEWLDEESWQSLRHFSTFFDSRVLIGRAEYLSELKKESFQLLEASPTLYHRLVDNVDFMKKGLGLFGQLLPELHGEMAGSIKLKQPVFYPYVNSLRLLAIRYKVYSPSTLSRFQALPSSLTVIKRREGDFKRLLDFRLQFRKDAKSYQDVHMLPLHALTKRDKKELKSLMRKGYKLVEETKALFNE